MNPRAWLAALTLGLGLSTTACLAGEDGLEDDIELEDGDDLESTEDAAKTTAALAPAPGSVSFGSDYGETHYKKGIPITKSGLGAKRVVYSVPLKDLQQGEKLIVRGDITISRCNEGDVAGASNDKKSPCKTKALKKDPYEYAPRVSLAVILADSPKATKGKFIQTWKADSCAKQEHHCQRFVDAPVFDKTPGATEKFVNLVVAADHDDAEKHHLVDVEDGKGGLQVIRLGVGHPGVQPVAAQELADPPGTLTVFDDETKASGKRVVMMTAVIEGAQAGDVLDVDGLVKYAPGNVKITPLVGAQLLLTTDPTRTKPGGPADALITENSGTNCPPNSKSCTRRKTGAFVVKETGTMYVNYIGYATRNSATGKEKLRVDKGASRLDVTLYRP